MYCLININYCIYIYMYMYMSVYTHTHTHIILSLYANKYAASPCISSNMKRILDQLFNEICIYKKNDCCGIAYVKL